MKGCRSEHGDYRDGCRLCFLARTREDYARLWDEPWPPPDDGVKVEWTDKPSRGTPKKTQWPVYALAISQLRADGDRGLGDTIHRHLARFGADALTRLYTKFTGRSCGCADRQAALNAAFPYEKVITRGVPAQSLS